MTDFWQFLGKFSDGQLGVNWLAMDFFSSSTVGAPNPKDISMTSMVIEDLVSGLQEPDRELYELRESIEMASSSPTGK